MNIFNTALVLDDDQDDLLISNFVLNRFKICERVKQFSNPSLEDRIRQRCEDMAQGEAFELAEAFHRVMLP